MTDREVLNKIKEAIANKDEYVQKIMNEYDDVQEGMKEIHRREYLCLLEIERWIDGTLS